MRLTSSTAWLVLVLHACALGSAGAQQPPPTREAIAALIDESVATGRQMDLIAAFGSDYRGLDLHGLRLKGVHAVDRDTILNGADFRASNLREADFGGAQLRGAIFEGAQMAGSSFVTADLTDADFRGASLAGATFQECLLAGANLEGLDLRGVSFGIYGCRLMRAVLRGCDLRGVDLSSCDLTGADLTGADLRGANLSYVELRGAQLTGARLDGVVVEGADFRGALGLPSAELRGVVERSGIERIEAEFARQQLLRSLELPAYLALVLLTALLSFASWRAGEEAASSRRLLALAANAVVAVGPALMVAMTLSGGSPTAQLSLGSMNWWSFWFMAWPVLVITTPLAGMLLLGLFAVSLSRRSRATWVEVGSHLAGGVLAAATWFFVMANFPDA